jgi:quinoprotein dehydrogenase-associated probable ABC transporter substrate-binding protein
MERSNPGTSTRWTPRSRSLLAPASGLLFAAFACLVLVPVANGQQAASAVLKVCADPNNLPQSDTAGAGYENKLAEALAKDLGRKVEYTFFPQRMGFVRQTLRAQDDETRQFKCDVIIGVPKGYELTATTQPYMRSIYALVMPGREEFKKLATAEDVLKLPPATLGKLRFGIFARSPATDWLLKNGLIAQARVYATQSGDPDEHPANIIERDLAAGNIDLAIVWGPVAGFLADRHKTDQAWLSVPFQPDPAIKFDYEIAMGVRFGEKEWKDTLDQWISTHQDDIRKILTSYRVPILEPSATKVSASGDARPPDAR